MLWTAFEWRREVVFSEVFVRLRVREADDIPVSVIILVLVNTITHKHGNDYEAQDITCLNCCKIDVLWTSVRVTARSCVLVRFRAIVGAGIHVFSTT